MTEQLTLYDKIWTSHFVGKRSDGQNLLYIDKQLLHEVTSPQAFEGLREENRTPWRTSSNIATPDHNVPTEGRDRGIDGITDTIARKQVETLDWNCKEFGIKQFGLSDIRQGIVHVVGPEQGLTLPGMTIVCGDSHTSTHGAFGALAQGVGTSDVEHVLATQCLIDTQMKNFEIRVDGELCSGVYAKDLILFIIGKVGTAGATGYTIEYTGSAISELSMEGRMTVCNMSIEAGARAGLIGIDDTTLQYLKGKPFVPSGVMWESAEAFWRALNTDRGAVFDETLQIDATNIKPQVTWGTSPEMVISIDEAIPSVINSANSEQSDGYRLAMEYMGVEPDQPVTDLLLDKVFIGSCTNSRIEDLRAAASILKGKKVDRRLKQCLVVPGSGLVKEQAEQEGLAKIFTEAGFEWRSPGCSMCLGMNPDRLQDGERCASTSNRNFEGRQGYGGRTHLVSPAMAAAASLAGRFIDVREFL